MRPIILRSLLIIATPYLLHLLFTNVLIASEFSTEQLELICSDAAVVVAIDLAEKLIHFRLYSHFRLHVPVNESCHV